MREQLINTCYWCGEEDKMFVKKYTDNNNHAVQCSICGMEYITGYETQWETINGYNRMFREVK